MSYPQISYSISRDYHYFGVASSQSSKISTMKSHNFFFWQRRSSSNLLLCLVAKFFWNKGDFFYSPNLQSCFKNKVIYRRENRMVGVIALCAVRTHTFVILSECDDFLRDGVRAYVGHLIVCSVRCIRSTIGSEDEQIIPWISELQIGKGGCDPRAFLARGLFCSRSIPQIGSLLAESIVVIYAIDCGQLIMYSALPQLHTRGIIC